MAITIKRSNKRTVNVEPAAKPQKAKQATPAPEVKAEPRQAAPDRFTHQMQFAYSGDSPVVTSRKSKTPIRVDEFGSAPNLILSDRDHGFMDPMKRKYGTRHWQRGNADAGIINRLIRKGVVKFVSGEPSDERAVLAFVK